MTIKIYPGSMPSQPIEEHAWTGTIADWFASEGIDYAAKDVQPIALTVNGLPVHVDAWASTAVSHADLVEIKPIPGADPLTWLYVAVAVFAVASFVMRPKIPGTGNTQQGQNLSTAEGTANAAKPNGVVPELLGRFRRYPDYLVQPRRYFADKRNQWLEMLLCIGPGTYDVEAVRIGDTNIASLDGFESRIYEPGADLSNELAAQNWYLVREVGGTSAGTAGLELTSEPDDYDLPKGVQVYDVDGLTFKADAPLPASWDNGLSARLHFKEVVRIETRTYEVHTGPGPLARTFRISRFTGRFVAVRGLQVGSLVLTDASNTGTARIAAMEDNLDGTLTIELQHQVLNQATQVMEWADVYLPPTASRKLYFSHNGSFAITGLSEGGATASLQANGSVLWSGFEAASFDASDVIIEPIVEDDYGAWMGPFDAAPLVERPTTFEVDFFCPGGLVRLSDSGKRRDQSVSVQIAWRCGAEPWTVETKTYTEATLDQIGFTERFTASGNGRLQVMTRRKGATSTSTQVQDKIQWYGLRSLLPGPTSYPWTTLAVKIKGLGQIAASSENRINVIATRKLPTLQPDGTWGPEVPARDITAAAKYIMQSIGYTDANIEKQEWQRLHDLWTARGETFDFVFDETTAGKALDAVFGAGMAEKTMEDGRIKPVREGVRTVFEFAEGYSMQNTLEGIKRAFRAPKHDDHDGVEIEYTDEESWVTKTQVCKLPGSLGIKLEKIKLQGVTSRTRAYRIGMRRASQQRYSRWSYTFATEMDALNSSYGSYVPLITDVPGFGQSAILTRITGDQDGAVLTASEQLRWEDGQPHVLALRRANGSTAGPWPATPGADAYTAQVVGIRPEDWPEVTLSHEPPHVYFGTATRWTHPALITEIRPQGMQSVSVTAKNYDAREYAYDDAFPDD